MVEHLAASGRATPVCPPDGPTAAPRLRSEHVDEDLVRGELTGLLLRSAATPRLVQSDSSRAEQQLGRPDAARPPGATVRAPIPRPARRRAPSNTAARPGATARAAQQLGRPDAARSPDAGPAAVLLSTPRTAQVAKIPA